MRYAVIEAGFVTNVVVASPELASEQGWIPGEFANIGDFWDGETFSKPPEPPPTQQDFDAALVNHLDAVAQSWGFDNRINFAVRTGYENVWRQKAIVFAEWMDQCNEASYQLLEAVLIGAQTPPATISDFIATLPAVPLVLLKGSDTGTIPVTVP